MNTHLIPIEEFQRIREARIDRYAQLALIADMCRANTIASIKRAGSGHLGSSFSSLDIVTHLYLAEMNTLEVGMRHPDRDIYFSSKGHDVPGLYAVFYSLGVLPREKFLRLRRLKGTCGHPDVSLPGIEANTGSLGMGISKGKGMAFAKALRGNKGRIFVMTGDGELQEGQIYESLQTAVHQRITNLNVIVDNNRVQSDKLVREIIDLGKLEDKFRAFGWHVARCDGHDFRQLEERLKEFRTITDKPKILIADTIKGRGVSFMEHPVALRTDGGVYRWHSGAPDDVSFTKAYDEIIMALNTQLTKLGLAPLKLEEIPSDPPVAASGPTENVADAYGQTLVELAEKRKELIVLDADLSADCRVRSFEHKYPERFIENGIAEQDMVSMAGGLALQGFLPVVNSFGCFLSPRANEQIYNNSTERTKIIYVCHFAGLIPAGPGHSHQCVRDISLFGSLPGMEILQPCNATETRMAVAYCVNEAKGPCMLRLIIGPSPRRIELPADYRLTLGRGAALTTGKDAVLFTYGPVMLNQALIAADSLRQNGFGLRVINLPWLNHIDTDWLRSVVSECQSVFVLEDHAPRGGLGDTLLETLVCADLLSGRSFGKFGVEGVPAWGTAAEVLHHHGLDATTIAEAILQKHRSAKT